MNTKEKEELKLRVLTAQMYQLKADLNKSEKMWEEGEDKAKIIGYLQGSIKCALLFNADLNQLINEISKG